MKHRVAFNRKAYHGKNMVFAMLILVCLFVFPMSAMADCTGLVSGATGTIDLGGSTCTLASAITISGNATITNGTIKSDADDVLTVDGGALSLGSNLTVECTSSVIWAKNNATVIIDGAKITGKSGGANAYTTVFAELGSNITINSGTVTSEVCTTLAAGSNSTITINSGAVSNTVQSPAFCTAYSKSGGKIILDGGEISSTYGSGLVATGNSSVELKSGTVTSASDMYAVLAHEGNAKALISGGTANGAVGAGSSRNGDNNTLTISGGTINGKVYETKGTVSITGGTFDEEPDESILGEYNVAVQNEDGTWSVKTAVYVKPDAGQSKTYDNDPAVPDSYAYKLYNKKGGEITNNLEKTGKLGRDEGEDAGPYEYTLGDLKLAERHIEAGYYLILEPDEGVVFTIEPKKVTLIKENVNTTYTGAEQLPTITYTDIDGNIQSAHVTLEEGQDNVNVGKYKALISISDQNYVPDREYQYCNITPAELTLTWSGPYDFEYDGEEHHPDFTLKGCVGDDTEGDGLCTDKFIKDNMLILGQTWASDSVYNTNVHLSDQQKNYKLGEYEDETYMITPKPITIIWEGNEEKQDLIEKEYNGTAQHLTAEIKAGDIVVGDSCVLTISKTATDVSDGQVRARADFSKKSGTYESCKNNYEITDENRFQYFVITPKSVELTWTDTQVPYDGTEQKPSASYVNVKDETVEVESIQTDPVVSVNAGAYTATAESDNPNYVFANDTADFTITPKTLTVNWEGDTFEYNGKIQRPVPSIEEGGLTEVDAAHCVIVAKGGEKDASEDAYTARAQWSIGSDKSCRNNYSLDELTQTHDYYITPLEAVIVWDEYSFIYNGQEQCPKASVNNPIGSDVCEVTVEGGQTDAGDDYQATATALSNSNYKLPENAFITFEITPLEVDIEWSNEDPFTYNGEPQAPTAQYKDIEDELKDAAISITDKAGNPLEGAVDAGEYIAIASIAEPNYAIKNIDDAERTFTIGKGTLTVVPTGLLTKRYGEVDPTPFNYEIRNVKGKDHRSTYEQSGSWLTRVYAEVPEPIGLYDFIIDNITLKDKYAKNFDLVLDESIKFQITDGKNEITAWPVSLDVTYNGEEQVVISPAQAKYGTVLYSWNQTDWSEALPTWKNAGDTDTFWYMVDGGENYEDIAPTSYYAKVLPAPLTVTPDSGQTKVYGEADPDKFTYTVSGNVAGETPVFTGALKRAAGEDAGTYFIRKGNLDLDENEDVNKNYTYEPATGFTQKVLFTITPKVVELTWSDTEFTYDGTSHVPTAEVTNTVGEDECIVTVEGAQTNAGTDYPATATALSSDNYTLEGAENTETTFVINPAVLTVTPVDGQFKVWDGNAPEEIEFTVDGVAEGDEPLTGALTIDTDVYDAGTFEIKRGTLSVIDENYDPDFEFTEGVTYEIKKAQASITTVPSRIGGLVYNGEEQNLVRPGEADGGTLMYFFKDGEESETPPTGTDAGEYRVYYYVKGDKNHEDLVDPDNTDPHRYKGIKVTIAPAQATVKADDITITYGDPEPTLTATVTGTFGSDTVAYTLSVDGEHTDAGTYEITATGEEEQGNYVVDFENGTLTINKAQSSIKTEPTGKTGLVYNGGAQDLIEPGEAEGGDIMYFFKGGEKSTTPPQGTDAGEYRVYYYVKGDKNHEDLVDPTNPEDPQRYYGIKVNIAQAEATVTAEDKSITYGQQDPDFTVTIDGLQGEDTKDLIEYTISRESGDNVGEYAITPAGEESQDNYHVTFMPGTLTIGQAKVTVTVTGREVTAVYDGEVHTTVYDMRVTSDPTNKYDLNDVKFVGTAWRIDETNVGEYVLALKPADFENTNKNYDVTFETVNGKLTIKPAEATVIADDKMKVYGEDDPEFTAQVVGLYGEDTVTYSFTREDGEDVGSYEITVTGEENQGNYHVNFVNGTLTIGQAKVTVTVTGREVTAVYDGEVHTTVYDMEVTSDESGKYDLNDVKFVGTAWRIDETDAGEYVLELKPEYFENINENYIVEFETSNGTLTINEAKVTVKVTGREVTAVYDGEVHTTVYDMEVTSDESGKYDLNDVKFVGTAWRIDKTDAGEYELALKPADFENTNKNYDVTFETVNGKLTIEPRLAEIEWHGRVQYYDGTPILPTATVSNLIGDDECEVTVVCNEEHVNAGVYTAFAAELSNPNYKLPDEAPSTIYEIREKLVEVVWSEIEKEYNGKEQLPIAVIKDSDLVAGDSCTVIVVLEEGPQKDAGDYTAVADSFEEPLCNQNYSLSDATLTTPFKITPKTVALTWMPEPDPILFSYDGEPHRPEASYTNVEEKTVSVTDDEMTIEPVSPAVNFGDYTATAKSADTNYVFSEETASKDFQIVAKAITVVPSEGQSMIYGTPDDELNLTYTLEDEEGNRLSEPVLEGKLGHEGTTVGEYEFNMGSLELKDEDKGNYTLVLDTSVMFTIDPKPVSVVWGNTELTYNGDPQVPVAYVPDEEIEEGDTVKVIYSEDSYQTDAGEGYAATVTGLDNENYVLAEEPVTTTFNIAKADLEPGVDFTAPQGVDGLSYNGEAQDLITAGSGKCVDGDYCTFQYEIADFESEMITKGDSMSEDIPQGTDAGTYTINWMVLGDNNHNDYTSPDPITVRIAPTELAPANIIITPGTSFIYNGIEKKVEFTVVNDDGTVLTRDVDYEVVKAETAAFGPGTYEIIINGIGGYRGTNIRKTWNIFDHETIQTFNFYRLTSFWDRGNNCPTFGCDQQLPATGFPTRFRMPLSVRPENLKYEDLGMRLQIPALEVSVDLVGVPKLGNDWAIEWLGADAGILSGTSEPGRGYTMIAGHNHLNESEMGPFLNLGSLKEYDTIYITLENGMNLPFSVYANELLRPDDYEKIAGIAAEDPNTLVLVTCENESKDGGYLNRRVVFAKPF